MNKQEAIEDSIRSSSPDLPILGEGILTDDFQHHNLPADLYKTHPGIYAVRLLLDPPHTELGGDHVDYSKTFDPYVGGCNLCGFATILCDGIIRDIDGGLHEVTPSLMQKINERNHGISEVAIMHNLPDEELTKRGLKRYQTEEYPIIEPIVSMEETMELYERRVGDKQKADNEGFEIGIMGKKTEKGEVVWVGNNGYPGWAAGEPVKTQELLSTLVSYGVFIKEPHEKWRNVTRYIGTNGLEVTETLYFLNNGEMMIKFVAEPGQVAGMLWSVNHPEDNTYLIDLEDLYNNRSVIATPALFDSGLKH